MDKKAYFPYYTNQEWIMAWKTIDFTHESMPKPSLTW
jgi:hypothetical protein